MKNKLPAVHHIHIKVGHNIYTLSHDGAYVDVLYLLNQIAFLQDCELSKAMKGCKE